MGAILQRWAARLRLGQLPDTLRAQLESEDRILYLAEGIWEWAIFRHFKSWAHDARWARCGFIGFFALSERRMVVIVRARYAKMEINVAYDEARFQKMMFAIRPKYLSLAFDASIQSSHMSGQVELRLHLPDIAAAAKILEQAGARIESNGS